MDVVNGSRAAPEETATAVEKARFVVDNSTAMLVISSTMEARYIYPLLSYSTVREMWNKSIQIHEQKSVSNKLILTQSFHEYKIESNDSVVKHMAKIESLVQQIRDVGLVVDDVTVMAKILDSLLSKYNALKTACG